MALDAALVLRQGARVRRMPLAEFYVDYMKNRLEPGEFVQAIEVPLAGAGRRCAPTRSASASTATSRRCAPASRSRSTASTVRDVRLAFGGMAAIVKRAAQAEAAVRRPALDRGDAARRAGRAGRRLRAADRHARERATTGCRWRRTCCTASGSKPAPHDAARRRRRPASGARCRMPRRSRARSHDDEQAARSAPARRTRRRRRRPAPRVGSEPRRTSRRTCTSPAQRDLHRRHPELAGTLHAALGLSPVAHGRLHGDRPRRDRAPLPGVVAVLTAADIPGPNDCGPIVHDDPILAERRGALPRPAGVRGDRRRRATRRAAPPRSAKEVLDIEPLPPVLTPRDAHAAQQYVLPPMHLARGDARARDRRARRTASKGTLEVGGQEQFYLEGQISYAIPREDDGMLVHCSTQHPSEMQHLVAHALDLHAHHVQVECRRMGGGFGGKESQSALFACVAAVAANKLQPPGEAAPRPRRRLPDHRPAPLLPATTTRSATTTTAASSAPRSTMVSRAGFSADLSGPVMTRAICHFDNAYWLPDVAIHGYSAQDQHAEQHRLPRLRRPAGRDRDREHPRLDRAHARQGPARRAPRQLLRQRRERNVTPYGQARRRQRHPRAGRPSSKRAATTARGAQQIARLQRRRARC